MKTNAKNTASGSFRPERFNRAVSVTRALRHPCNLPRVVPWSCSADRLDSCRRGADLMRTEKLHSRYGRAAIRLRCVYDITAINDGGAAVRSTIRTLPQRTWTMVNCLPSAPGCCCCCCWSRDQGATRIESLERLEDGQRHFTACSLLGLGFLVPKVATTLQRLHSILAVLPPSRDTYCSGRGRWWRHLTSLPICLLAATRWT